MDNAMRGLGRFVRERRDELKMNQGELGEAIGRDQKYVSDIERGAIVNLPPIEVLRPMAATLRCSMADLLTAAGYIAVDDEERFSSLRESATTYQVATALEAVRADVDRALEMVRGLMDERGTIITDGRQ